jgi:Arc/MetJ-type ribon-helix-helix transcriptional regulator
MSFTEVLEELPGLTLEQRQLLIRRALELDEPSLTPQDEALAEERLAKHRQNPESAVPLETMKARLRSRPPK